MSYTIYTDGSCMPNPGPMGSAYVILNSENVKITEDGIPGGQGTNNIAEYLAIKHALDALSNIEDIRDIVVYTDSMLVLNQITGKWKINKPELRKLCLDIKKILPRFSSWELKHVKAHSGNYWNEYVDTLAKEAII